MFWLKMFSFMTQKRFLGAEERFTAQISSIMAQKGILSVERGLGLKIKF